MKEEKGAERAGYRTFHARGWATADRSCVSPFGKSFFSELLDAQRQRMTADVVLFDEGTQDRARFDSP